MNPQEILENLITSFPENLQGRARRFLWTLIHQLGNSNESLRRLLVRDVLDRNEYIAFMSTLYREMEFVPIPTVEPEMPPADFERENVVAHQEEGGPNVVERPKTPDIVNSPAEENDDNLSNHSEPIFDENDEPPLTPGGSIADSSTAPEPISMAVKLPLLPNKSKETVPSADSSMPGPSSGLPLPAEYRPPPTMYPSTDEEGADVNPPRVVPKMKKCSVKLHRLSAATLQRLQQNVGRRRSRSSSSSSSSGSPDSYHSDCSGCIRKKDEPEQVTRKKVGLKHPKSSKSKAKGMRSEPSHHDLVYPGSESESDVTPPPIRIPKQKAIKKTRPVSTSVSPPPLRIKLPARCPVSSSGSEVSPPPKKKAIKKTRPVLTSVSPPPLRIVKLPARCPVSSSGSEVSPPPKKVSKRKGRIISSSSESSSPPRPVKVYKKAIPRAPRKDGSKGQNSPPPIRGSGVRSSGEPNVNKKFRLKINTRHVEAARQGNVVPVVPTSTAVRAPERRAVPANKKATKASEERFQCPQCSVSCNRKDNLDRHIKAAHTAPKLYKCPVKDCKFVCTREASLKDHKRQRHSKDPRIYPCRYCDAKFDTRQKRNAHECNIRFSCYKEKLAKEKKERSQQKKEDDRNKKGKK